MTVIHKTLQIINTQYPNESAYIFINSLNVLYLLNTQIKHPTLHNSHHVSPKPPPLCVLVRVRAQGSHVVS